MSEVKILVVEDSAITQETLRKNFTSWGCTVTCCLSGEEALDKLKSGAMFDIIILEFKLPGMSGPAFFKTIMMEPQWRYIPVVPFSSRASDPLFQSTMSQAEWGLLNQVKRLLPDATTPPGIISKGASEHVTELPDGLIVTVVYELLQHGVVLPPQFEEVANKVVARVDSARPLGSPSRGPKP
jgi:CheY-like chemotaxis protein